MEDFKMKKEFYLYVNGQKVKVSEEIYKVYWREREHEKYLEQVDRKNHLLFFSSLDHDGHYVDNIVDESVDVAKIVETQMMIESLRYAISKLNDEERDIIERLYFNDETLRSVAKLKSITHPALMKRRNKILEKLKKLSKNFKTSVTKGVNFSLCKVKGSLTSFTFLGKRYACLWQIGNCKENNPFQILLFDN